MMPSVKKYYYGADLMKSLHATGGAGGLLMVEIDGVKGYLYTNANGNVEAIYSADASAELLAEYEYSAFGETRKQSVALSEKNPLRYSTRYSEGNTGLYYYGYREYSPRLMKWLSKEPLGEAVDPNLYRFCKNNPAKHFDMLGNKPYPVFNHNNTMVTVHFDDGTWWDMPKKDYNQGIIDCAETVTILRMYFAFESLKALRAWNRYVSGSGESIVLTNLEMKDFFRKMNPLPEDKNARKYLNYAQWISDCVAGKHENQEMEYVPPYMAGDNWYLAVGGFSAYFTTRCQNCRSKTFRFKLNDRYDFPISNIDQDSRAGKVGRAVGVKEKFCGWKPFYHEGYLNLEDTELWK